MSTETVLALTPAGQSWLSFLISLVIVGLIVGAIARLIVPGPQPIGIIGTILAGVAGAFLAGIVGRFIFGPTYTPGLIMSILGAALIVWAIGRRSYGPRREYAVEREPVVVERRHSGFFGRRDSGFFGRRSSGMFGRRSSGLFGRRDPYDY